MYEIPRNDRLDQIGRVRVVHIGIGHCGFRTVAGSWADRQVYRGLEVSAREVRGMTKDAAPYDDLKKLEKAFRMSEGHPRVQQGPLYPRIRPPDANLEAT